MNYIENNKYAETSNDFGRCIEMKEKVKWQEILAWVIIMISGIVLILRILGVI